MAVAEDIGDYTREGLVGWRRCVFLVLVVIKGAQNVHFCVCVCIHIHMYNIKCT